MAHLNEQTLEIELTQEEKAAMGICIACDKPGTRTGNTLCQKHWYDAEGEND